MGIAMKSKVVAKAIVRNGRGEVLLLRRSQTDTRRPGEWDFPGGVIETGEDMAAGTSREIYEESGLAVGSAQLQLMYGATELYQNKESVTRLLFSGETDSDTVQLSFEHDDYRWVSIDTALEEFPHPFYGVGLRYARDNDLLE
jgi:8-oxo-dGTP diphosphatase